MTTTRTGVVAAVPALVLALVLAGCSGSDTSDGSPEGEDEPGTGEPTSTTEPTDGPTDEPTVVPKPEVTADLRVEPGADSVAVTYSVTNVGDRALLLVNRLPRVAGAGTSYDSAVAYVTGDDEGGVEISQRAFPWPDGDVERAAAPEVGAAVLAAGAVTQVSLLVPLPFVGSQPFGDDLPAGVSAVPDAPTEVTFCLGILPRDAGKKADADGVVRLAHGNATAQAQYVLCSEPVELG